MPDLVPAAPARLPGADRSLWKLAPGSIFLNHGSFGARLHTVADAQTAWRDRFEARPILTLDREIDALLYAAKAPVGAFLGMAPDQFGFVTNASEGVNAVVRSLRFNPGDEIVTTNHGYGAVLNTLRYEAERTGATVTIVDIPLPTTPSAVEHAVIAALSERTRLVVIDHVTSPTALRFPVEPIIAACRAQHIPILVDGAHAPGMLDLDVTALGATFYTGNLHKWISAPPGCAFLHVDPSVADMIHPMVISHYLGEGFAREFAWQGTRDTSAWFAAPDAISALGALGGPGGWDAIRAHNHALTNHAHAVLRDAWDAPALSPENGSMLGSIVSLPVPAAVRARFETPLAFQCHLFDTHDIEIPIFEWGDDWLIRPSAQLYNHADEYALLASAVRELTS